ncbi:NAD(P)H-dependent oxidoreductase [Companilactobacillus kimchiensis]|uniref:Flavodoxin n=1 Tax=Companilactobacillus kimchiensis TaxID=993692 RepID=A0A0R2LEN1_9LACO|nr:NAD(P)H-dependent oxidoreductase [Companilactobacillus kimchiensis]KRN99921.1 flavodoxin [Companilactobacillus kimchiensis]
MKTIIYAHPYVGSFNHEILNRLSNSFSMNDEEFEVINPYADNFNPLLMGENLETHGQGQTNDELVKRYQRKISASNELIFIFPIWWQNMPAMLKGFFDKTMLNGFAYNEDNGWKGLLTYIKRVTVITTSTVTKSYLQNECGDPIQGVFINRTLADLGITPQNVKWIHFGEVNTTTDKEREKFLEDLPKMYTKK